MTRIFAGTALACLALSAPVRVCVAQTAPMPPAEPEAVVIHPIVHPHFTCVEHPAGQLTHLGDALASDCLVANIATGPAGRFPAFFRESGTRNEDWYGWREPVLAPFDGVVDSVFAPPAPNRPGQLGRVRAGVVVFSRADGVSVLYAHVQNITVRPGDHVQAGQAFAEVGNNGPAYFPHTHVGAWRGTEPLQIRFDLVAMGRMSRRSHIGRRP